MIIRRISNNEIYHHGIKGQRWGIRRYQNPDGSLTSAGMKRYQKQQRKIDESRKKGLTSNDRRVVAKNTKYLTDEEVIKRGERFKAEDAIRSRPVKQYTEGQKFALRMVEKTITIAAVSAAAFVGYKYFKKNIVNTQIYNTAMSAIKSVANKGETVVKASQAVNETVKDAVYTSKKVVNNVSKMTSNPNEIKARIAAQNAVKNGASTEVAKKIYKKVLEKG